MIYNIGDIVRVRSWESLEEEFGLSLSGDIELTDCVFVPQMREYCGGTYEITEKNESYYVYHLEGCSTWFFTDEMFERNTTHTYDKIDDIDVESIDFRVFIDSCIE